MKKDKYIDIAIILLPLFISMIIISIHSSFLFNKLRLIFVVLITLFLIYIIFRKPTNRKQLKEAPYILYYILIFLLIISLYRRNSWIKKYIIEEANYNIHYTLIKQILYDK